MAITIQTDPKLTIGAVALAAGVKPSTIRYYERKKLLPAPPRSGGQRRYNANILQLLRVIEVSKDAGFSLKEIGHLLHGFERRTPPSKRWRALTQEKLREVDALIARAQGMRALLTRGLECGCLTLGDCRLIEQIGTRADGDHTERNRSTVPVYRAAVSQASNGSHDRPSIGSPPRQTRPQLH